MRRIRFFEHLLCAAWSLQHGPLVMRIPQRFVCVLVIGGRAIVAVSGGTCEQVLFLR